MVTIVILSLSSLPPSSVCVLLASSICTPTGSAPTGSDPAGSDPTGSAGESVCISRTSIRHTHNYLVQSHTYIHTVHALTQPSLQALIPDSACAVPLKP